jgi:hypothetical protein
MKQEYEDLVPRTVLLPDKASSADTIEDPVYLLCILETWVLVQVFLQMSILSLSQLYFST